MTTEIRLFSLLRLELTNSKGAFGETVLIDFKIITLEKASLLAA